MSGIGYGYHRVPHARVLQTFERLRFSYFTCFALKTCWYHASLEISLGGARTAYKTISLQLQHHPPRLCPPHADDKTPRKNDTKYVPPSWITCSRCPPLMSRSISPVAASRNSSRRRTPGSEHRRRTEKGSGDAHVIVSLQDKAVNGSGYRAES